MRATPGAEIRYTIQACACVWSHKTRDGVAPEGLRRGRTRNTEDTVCARDECGIFAKAFRFVAEAPLNG